MHSSISLFQLTLTLLTIGLLSLGQVLFKIASKDLSLNPSEFIHSLMNLRFCLAITIYGIATILWLIILKDLPLRIAYPFAALAFFFVPIMAHFALGEAIGWNTFIGAAIITIGVVVSTLR